MTGVFDSLVADMHSTQITASSTYHQHQQPPSGGGAGPGGSNGSSLHKPQESPTLPVSTATDSSYYTNQQHPAGGGGGSPYAHMGSYQYHASGLNNVPYSAKSGYDLGYTAAYTSYAPYGTSSSPANNEPGMLKVGTTGAKSGLVTGRWGADKNVWGGIYLEPWPFTLLAPCSPRALYPPKSSIGRGSPDIPQVVGPQVVAPGGLSSADVHASR